MYTLLPLLLLAGCADEATDKDGAVVRDSGEDGGPDIAVSPTSLAFGDVDVGAAEPSIQTVTVRNEGADMLQITGVELENSALASVYTLSAVGSVVLPPGGETSFTVTFAPLTFSDYDTHVLIESDDPDEPQVAVPLTARGGAPVIQLSPSSYDFGTLYIGCDDLQPITISNVGNADLVVSGLEYVSASVDLAFDGNEDVNGPLPWTIASGRSLEVYVGYAPLDAYDDEGFVVVSSNDPFQPTAQTFQFGGGAPYGENVDVFEQPVQGRTDILFTLDWSSTMPDDIARFQSQFGTFIATLEAMDADYHVAVVTDDDGCVNGFQPYVDNTMAAADQEALFDTMVNSYSYGAYTEMGFTLLEAATSATNLARGGCNDGLIRDDATLAMIGLTDEPEQSANPWSYYVSLFQSLKRDPDDLVVHAVAGDYPDGCEHSAAGAGWYEATVATGGLFLSICDTDWASHTEALAEASSPPDPARFELSAWPVPETIEVRVDGVPTSTGWAWNEADNAIEFDTASVPEGGAVVEVEYVLLGDCEG